MTITYRRVVVRNSVCAAAIALIIVGRCILLPLTIFSYDPEQVRNSVLRRHNTNSFAFSDRLDCRPRFKLLWVVIGSQFLHNCYFDHLSSTFISFLICMAGCQRCAMIPSLKVVRIWYSLPHWDAK